jgi:acyl-[acyl carrier protein]--UDP-N-acetylglucosamine O-acyltransferase
MRLLKRAYRILFGHGTSLAGRLDLLRDLAAAEPGAEEIAELVRFVASSERGFARPR